MTAALVAAAVVASFEVTVGSQARELSIDARYTGSTHGCYRVDEGFSALIDGLDLGSDGCFRFPAKQTGEARVRYRYRLAEATARDRFGHAWENPEGVRLFRPSIFLLRPAAAPADGDFRLVVHTPPGLVFATGLERAGDAGYVGRMRYLQFAPYSLFGPADEWHVAVGGGRQDVAVVGAVREVPRADLERWVTRAATAVSGYLGRFPIPRVQILLVPNRRNGVGHGTAWGFGGASIVMNVGPSTRVALDADWELTHEMVHLALPNLPRAQRWMEEGLATYGEIVARPAAGQRSEREAWHELVTRLPRGLPQEGDQGLDRTHTWARTYWGGALFWFVVDVRLRERTKGAVGVPELLQRLLEDDRDIRSEERIDDWLRSADRAAGEPVVSEVYAELAAKPGRPDLDRFWQRLGVQLGSGSVTFDDEAPLAMIRQAMTRPAASR